VGVAVLDDDPLADEIVTVLENAEGVTVDSYDDEEALKAAVRRKAISQGVVVAEGFGAEVRTTGVGDVRYVVDETDPDWFTVRTTVDGLLGQVGARTSAAHVVADLTGESFHDVYADFGRDTARSGTNVIDVGDERVRDLSAFALIAPQQLVLFVFVNALGAAVALVVARRSGVLQRAFATRTGLGTLLLGVLLAWFMIALLESVLLVSVGAIGFGVDWGQPAGAIALIVLYSLVGAGAGVLIGTVGANEDRVSAIGPATGMVLGALGGCMVPLEFFPPAMLTVARFTPHYWAVTGWQNLVLDGDGIGDIVDSLAMLLLFAALLAGVSTFLLRRQLRGN
jgi:ABC-2 type transport system permease protein